MTVTQLLYAWKHTESGNIHREHTHFIGKEKKGDTGEKQENNSKPEIMLLTPIHSK